MLAPQDRLATLPDGIPTLTLGYEALAWAAKYLRHTNGLRAGKPWQFTREQARFVLWFYSVDDRGRWLFDRGDRRLAKGSGKSPFAAVMALIELLAPVRFRSFDDSVPGGCLGKPVSMPWVQIAAVSLDQTENTMRHIRAMVAKNNAPELHRDYQLDVGKTQVFVAPEGKLEVITSSAATAEGAEVTFVIGDELEHWTPSNGGVELHNTLVDNLTKSGSRFLGTLNAWKPGINSVGETVFDDWVSQESGVTKVKTRILYDARIAPPDTDMSDEESLRAGLEWVYQDCPWADIDAIIARIWRVSAKPDDSKRKYLNWPVASSDSWADPQDWAQMADPTRAVADGEDIVMFFDGSLSSDNTALVGCCMSDGHVFTIGVWEPQGDDDGKKLVDVAAVDNTVRLAHDRWNVVAFFADVREWEAYTKVVWPEVFADTLQILAKPSSRSPELIAWDMRSKDFEFTTAAELCENEIQQHSFTHDGDARLTRHVHNARRYEGRYGITVRKESKTSARKIDACVCMIGARMVWRLAKTDQNKKPQYTGEAFFL
ncbi:terminase [Corynebacterium diphtheriae]|uniref:terminase n=1 Tax=Corynebacterium diphtheriae TaxID=1717 RepID=UPI00103D0CCA|nr:terminase [Corynebacterium diphtheriae]MBG9357806.1 terminase [Corynebacterium diphtheriae bv. mitis]MBN4650433.1 terminase [Corynebacterium diphtheriae bv. mitis]MBN4652655.1 terminase [Corynebacterium diphtheriae bv. mitis]TBX14216.1 terminase [Corynebacterium diphtheriae]